MINLLCQSVEQSLGHCIQSPRDFYLRAHTLKDFSRKYRHIVTNPVFIGAEGVTICMTNLRLVPRMGHAYPTYGTGVSHTWDGVRGTYRLV